MRYLVLIFSCLLLGCEYFQPKETTTERVVARVGRATLEANSLSELMPKNASKADSMVFAEKFLTDWIKKQLMIQRAQDVIDFNEAKIQNKVLDYQYALMVHELEKRYIEKNLDQQVSEEEIKGYYDLKSENFILQENLAKCIYFKIPNSAPQTWRMRRSLKNYPADTAELWKYSDSHAVKAFKEDSVWVKFDEVLLETPLSDISDKARFLKANRSIEVSDQDYIYFLKIFEYRLIGEVAPLEFIKDRIVDVLINKRKILLKKELEKKIYEEAEQSDAFEIFTD